MTTDQEAIFGPEALVTEEANGADGLMIVGVVGAVVVAMLMVAVLAFA